MIVPCFAVAWDQSDKFMKLYVTINGVQKLPKQNVTTEFKDRSVRISDYIVVLLSTAVLPNLFLANAH